MNKNVQDKMVEWWAPHYGFQHRKDFLDSSSLFADGLIRCFGCQYQENSGQQKGGYWTKKRKHHLKHQGPVQSVYSSFWLASRNDNASEKVLKVIKWITQYKNTRTDAKDKGFSERQVGSMCVRLCKGIMGTIIFWMPLAEAPCYVWVAHGFL